MLSFYVVHQLFDRPLRRWERDFHWSAGGRHVWVGETGRLVSWTGGAVCLAGELKEIGKDCSPHKRTRVHLGFVPIHTCTVVWLRFEH